MESNSLKITRLSAALGAEVSGMNLAAADATDIATIRRLLDEHMVLCFPGRHLDPSSSHGRASRQATDRKGGLDL